MSQITDVNGSLVGPVQARNSRDGTKQMYDVPLSDGQKYTTFDSTLAGKAAGFAPQVAGQAGPPITARVEVKPDGRGGFYKNLLDIAPQGQMPGLAAPVTAGAIVPAQQPGIVQPQVAVQPNVGAILPPVDQNAGPRRAYAAQTAFGFMAELAAAGLIGQTDDGFKLGEVIGLARRLTEELVGYALEGHFGGVQAAPLNTPQTPQEIAAAVPGVQVGVQGVEVQQAPQPPATGADAIPWD